MKESFPEPINRSPQPVNSPETTQTLAELAIPIQAMLALRLYHSLHPEESLDELHPNTVDRSIRGKAMELWLDEKDGEALSARFRTYLEEADHGLEPVPLSSVAVLDRILTAIGASGTTSLH